MNKEKSTQWVSVMNIFIQFQKMVVLCSACVRIFFVCLFVAHHYSVIVVSSSDPTYKVRIFRGHLHLNRLYCCLVFFSWSCPAWRDRQFAPVCLNREKERKDELEWIQNYKAWCSGRLLTSATVYWEADWSVRRRSSRGSFTLTFAPVPQCCTL